MTRQTAYQILTSYITNPVILQHSLATEAAMRTLALRLKEDSDEWAVTGLLHDADYEKCKGHPENHGLFLFTLEPNSIPTTIEQAIKAHNYEETHIMPITKMDWGLVCCDELTAIIASLVDRQKNITLATITPEIILQKLSDTNALKEAKKEHVFFCTEKLGIPLEEFITMTLSSMQQSSTELEPPKEQALP